jgi:hypothetical protein
MKQSFREQVEGKLPREDDKELFRNLLEAYDRGGPEEVKNAIQELVKNITGA